MSGTRSFMSTRLDLSRRALATCPIVSIFVGRWTSRRGRVMLSTMTERPPILPEALERGTAANDDGRSGRDGETRDPYVARAIAAMKAGPSRRWTVAALARVAGLSRAAFARRFTRELGVGPARWLTEHRLRIAQERLVETDLGLAAIASEIGYATEFAFAKAFKRMFGVAPGRFRRLARAPRALGARPSFRAAA